MAFGAAAMAADLPKEGTFSGTGAAAGTYKAYPVGKDRYVGTAEENGLLVGNGFLDHMTGHCFGTFSGASGIEQYQGYCVFTDPDGDQIVADGAVKHASNAKSFDASSTFTSGTGKYTGITGGTTEVLHGPEFKTPADGAYVQYGEIQGRYKLP